MAFEDGIANVVVPLQLLVRFLNQLEDSIGNTAAAHAIQNLYSSNSVANTFLRKLGEELRPIECFLIVVSLRSEDNAADLASRRRTCTAVVKQACVLVIEQKRADISQESDSNTTAYAELRHTAGPSDELDDELEGLICDPG